MKAFLSVLAAWLLSATLASAQMMGITGGPFAAGSSYTGPLDLVSSATFCYELRGCSAAYSTGSNNAINVRRASDNTTSNIVILSNGKLDAATMNTFAGVDATASCTIATTTATCTGASSTPHVGSTFTGVGITNPCIVTSVGTFTGGAGTLTISGGLGGTSPCGTVSVAVSVSLQYGLYLTEFYDQSGNGVNATQATAGNQPQIAPNCLNGYPCFVNTGSSQSLTSSSFTAVASPQSGEFVYARTNAGSTSRNVLVSTNDILESGAANQVEAAQASSFVTATASDLAWHTIQTVLNGGTSGITVDGTFTSGSTSARSTGTTAVIGGTNVGYITGAIMWGVALNSTQYAALCHNDNVYYALSLSC